MPRPILVTGATGFLGSHVRALAPRPFQGVGRNLAPGCAYLDLTDRAAITSMWEYTTPAGVLHLAAWANPGECERDPELSGQVNVAASDWLAKLAAEADVPFVFASTDLVFDGTQAPYLPTDAPAPIQTYGQQKADAEDKVRKRHASAVIARLPLMYDTALPGTSCFTSDLLGRWDRGDATPLFEDEFRTPALARDVAAALWDLLEHPGGTVHLGGPERIDRYTFGEALADAHDVDRSLLERRRQAELDLTPRRPADVSLAECWRKLRGPAHGIATMRKDETAADPADRTR